MGGLVPAIHALRRRDKGKTWITGTSPVMTIECVEPRVFHAAAGMTHL
jgi:hypothetical protein